MLIGNVGREPEVRHLDSGVSTTTITVATSESYTDKTTGERRTSTEWHNVVLWRQLAEFAEKYIRKGSQIFVEGKLRTRSWDDKDGQKRYTTEVVADVVRLLGGRREDNSNSSSNSSSSNTPSTASTPHPTPAATPATTPVSAAASPTEEVANSDDLPF
jgi:single-strand DNA-binding protein